MREVITLSSGVRERSRLRSMGVELIIYCLLALLMMIPAFAVGRARSLPCRCSVDSLHKQD